MQGQAAGRQAQEHGLQHRTGGIEIVVGFVIVNVAGMLREIGCFPSVSACCRGICAWGVPMRVSAVGERRTSKPGSTYNSWPDAHTAQLKAHLSNAFLAKELAGSPSEGLIPCGAITLALQVKGGTSQVSSEDNMQEC